jgi:uncharacterized protein YlaI
MIKLENIVIRGFDKQTGELKATPTEEYVCDNCRRLVDPSDKYCEFCGDKLVPVTDTEHHVLGEQLSHLEFNQLRTKGASEIRTLMTQRREVRLAEGRVEVESAIQAKEEAKAKVKTDRAMVVAQEKGLFEQTSAEALAKRAPQIEAMLRVHTALVEKATIANAAAEKHGAIVPKKV